MGLLNRIAGAVGEVGEKVFNYEMNKMAKEDELKMREEIELAKEKRVAEQWEKQHTLLRGEAKADELDKYKREDDPNRLPNRTAQTQLDKSQYELEQLKNPNSVHNRKELLGLDVIRGQIGSANASANARVDLPVPGAPAATRAANSTGPTRQLQSDDVSEITYDHLGNEL